MKPILELYSAEVSDKDAARYMLMWCDMPHDEWPTLSIDINHHFRLIKHRDNHWKGGTKEEFIEFVRQYAFTLLGK